MTNLEKYAYTVFVEGSFSAAAKELFISQPALSASIARLEGELGFRIFDRSVNPIALTAEGRIYIEYLEEKSAAHASMKKRIRMINEISGAEICVGAYAYSAYPILANTCGIFAKRHPDVKVNLDMGSVGHLTNLSDKMRKREIDLMLNYDFDPKEHSASPILSERLIIAMHRSMQGAEELIQYAVSKDTVLKEKYTEKDTIVDISIFNNVPFLKYAPFSNTKKKMGEILGEYKTANFEVSGARQVSMHNKLMQNGVGAIMTTDFHVASGAFSGDDILYFIPRANNAKRTLYVITPKDTEPVPAAKLFIKEMRLLYPYND